MDPGEPARVCAECNRRRRENEAGRWSRRILTDPDFHTNCFTCYLSHDMSQPTESPRPSSMLHRIVPMLPVQHLPRSLGFYAGLGFEVETLQDSWGWAMLRLGDCRIMLDQSIFHATQRPSSAVLYLYPVDIDAFHAEARRQGLTVPDLEATFYGMREFRIEDPDGNRLWIGQPVGS